MNRSLQQVAPVTDYIQMYLITITITLLFHDYRLQLHLS